MPNRMFFAIFVSLCALNFDAFAATARGNVRGNAASANVDNTQQNTPVAARAASRQRVVNTVNVAPQDAGNVVSARAGSRQKVANTPSAPAPVAARAASSQKVIQTGSKIASATANTVVSQECQDAFYGCMDSFCMLDNVSGGRCSCSNKNAELNAVLDDILKLDEQSYAMATEGVERIKLGENADEVIARAKAAGDKAAGKEVADDNKKKSRTLDLSAWNNNVFNMDDDIFEDLNSNAVSEALSKEGDALYREATKLCVGQIPTQCRNSLSMLQSVYAQKIKSDCMAYENSLKQQKSASAQKLQTAEKALREAALEKFNEENKYGLGQCQVRYAQCMQTTAGCGEDYSGCVTMAAAENVKSSQNKASKSKQTKIKGALTTIELAASTIDQLVAKKNVCDDEVLKYCVKVKDQVWNAFLTDAAPALKSAELMAEQKLRENCMVDVASCFNSACASQFGTDASDKSYDMCLSDPSMFIDLCKIKIEPCLEATGGSLKNLEESSLWNGVSSILAAKRVDSCTKEVKGCIESICGTDYAGCVGLDVTSVAKLCPVDTLTACKNENKGDEEAVLKYIADVAQGYALQIDNAFMDICQKAADESMIKVCGSTDSCDNADFDLSTLSSLMKVQACKQVDSSGPSGTDQCYAGIDNFSDDEIYTKHWVKEDDGTYKEEFLGGGSNGYGIYAKINGKPDISVITYDTNTSTGISFEKQGDVASSLSDGNTSSVVNILNAAQTRIMNVIKSDPKVQACMTGRAFDGFKDFKISQSTKNAFPNLTDNIANTVASSLLSSLSAKNIDLEKKFQDQVVELDNKISKRMAEIAEKRGDDIEAQLDMINAEKCTCNANQTGNGDKGCYSAKDKNGMRKGDGGNNNVSYRVAKAYIRELTDLVGSYDAATNVCTVQRIKYSCTHYLSPSCRTFDGGTVINTSTIQMTKFK